MKAHVKALSVTLAVFSFCLLVASHIELAVWCFTVALERPLWLSRVDWLLGRGVEAVIFTALAALLLHCIQHYKLPAASIVDLSASLIAAILTFLSPLWILASQGVIAHAPTPSECAQMRLVIPMDTGLLIAYVLLRLMAADKKLRPTEEQTEQSKAVYPPAHGLASWYTRITWFWLFLTQAANILWLWATVANQPALFGSESLPDAYFRLWVACGIGILAILAWGILLLFRLGIVQLPRKRTCPQLRPDAFNVLGGLSITVMAVASIAILQPTPEPYYRLATAPPFTQIATVIVLDIMLATAMVWVRRRYA